ncbi:MAG: hypothetical protein PVI92_12160 [Chromatiales bacterium]|jgi:hypothetical protein
MRRAVLAGLLTSSVACMLFTPITSEGSDADSGVGMPVEGVIVSVTGARMEIMLSDGQIVTATTTEPALAQEVVGKSVSGRIEPAGDTNLLTNPEIAE